jgi:ornithine carbamoyltransferase
VSLQDFSAEEIRHLLDRSMALKQIMKKKSVYRPLEGYSMSMIFEKRSTRTRVSAETGINYLGGHAIFLSSRDMAVDQKNIRDTALVLSRFNDIILARVFEHEKITQLAKFSRVPIINALSDKSHPLQILADLMTIEEKFGKLKGLTIAWVGDGNNVLHSLMEACPKLGLNLRIATPSGPYAPHLDVQEYSLSQAKIFGTEVFLTNNPVEAVKGAHIVVTDTWISMGQESEKEERMKSFEGYQVTSELTKEADPSWIFMHCLPRKQEEVSDEIFYSDRSVVWDEAENRMYTVMAVTLELLGK